MSDDEESLVPRQVVADELFDLVHELLGKDQHTGGLREAAELAQQVADKATEYRSLALHDLREGG